MYYARSGLKPVLASVAVLLLLVSGGVFAYASRVQSSDAGRVQPLDDTSQYSRSLAFRLIPVPVSSTYKNGQGEVGVVVQGLVASTSLAISGGTPHAQLAIMMEVISAQGSHSVNLGSVTLSDGGSAGFHTKTEFEAGTYQIGFQVNDVSTFATPTLVLISLPTLAQIVITSGGSSSSTGTKSSSTEHSTTSSSTETTKSSETGNPSRLVFNLVPAPVWQHQTAPDNYPFKKGGAVIYAMTNQIGLRISFIGTPRTEYSLVLQKNNDNVTVGTLTTDGGGGGALSSYIPVEPGKYQFGLLLYVTANVEPSNLVALSDPRGASGTVVGGTETSTTTTTRTSETETEHRGGNIIAYRLVSLPAYLLTAQPENYPFKSGGAYIKADGTTIQVLISFGATPNTHFLVDLTVDGQNRTIGDLVTNSEGGGYLKQVVPLDQGTFQVGFLIFMTSSTAGSPTLVGLSVPRTQTLVLPPPVTTTTETTTTFSHTETRQSPSLKFALLPVPVWKGNPSPDNYPFKVGYALIGLDGTALRIMISFVGIPKTPFAFVFRENGVNQSIGSLTTNADGAGTLTSTMSVNPGEYHFGILVFSPTADRPSNLVAVSIPRVEAASISNEGSSTSSSLQPRTFGFRLNPAPGVASSTSSYRFGRGEAGGIFADGYIAISASIFNANPNTHYTVLFTVNGTSHDIANLVTDENGNARVATGLKVGNDTLIVGMRVNDTSSFSTPTTVLVSDPSRLVISSHGVESEITTTTESQSENEGKSVLRFKIVGAQVQSLPSGYSLGKGVAYVAVDGQTLHLRMGIVHANPNTQYGISLSVNGTSTHVGSLITNHEGSGEVSAEWKLAPGTYLIGVLVYDTSSFNTPTLVMSSDPASLAALIVPTNSSTSSTTNTESEASHSVSTIVAGKGDEDRIKLAVSSLTISAVVHVGSSNASFSVIDPRFSVAVGRQANNGIIVSISATNVTGPKVLLLNLTQNSFLKLTGSGLNVTLDGNPVVQASSVTQVLDPSVGDPARYVLVATTSGLQLLISIPHFSLHLIQIVPIPVAQIQNFLIVNAEALVASILVITVVFAALYKTRQKIFSVFL